MSLRLALVYMHQAQLGQLAHHLFKMVRLRGPKWRLARKHRLRLCGFFDNSPLSCISLVAVLLGETDLDGSFLLGLSSFDFVRVTHNLQTKQILFSLVSGY